MLSALELLLAELLVGTIGIVQAYQALQAAGQNPPQGLTIAQLIAFTQAAIAALGGGTGTMAGGQCVASHSIKTPGAGLCCQQVGVGLTPPPAGTILPPYVAGQANAGQIPAGRIVTVTDAGGHCASCMIVGSTSAKHRGKPVLKFVRGGPACPAAHTGCCSL
jgi:hypothetical protein